MATTRSVIGKRGESIAVVRLTQLFGPIQPLFRPHFLGDTYPTIDFLVELLGVPTSLGVVPFFFIQAKATTSGYVKLNGNLKVRVSRADMARYVCYPAPTYIFGIDEPGERAYVFAATTGGPRQLSSPPTRYPLDQPNLQALYDEVLDYWTTSGSRFDASRFV